MAMKSTTKTLVGIAVSLLLISACTHNIYPEIDEQQNQAEIESFHGGHIFSLRQNVSVSLSELLAQMTEADYVMLGEIHDDPTHHILQTELLAALVDSGKRPAVVFEMFNREDGGIINSMARQFPGEPDRIAEAVNWQESGWPDWQMYRPIVQTAMDASLPIIAGNISRAKLRSMAISGTPLISERTSMQLGLEQPLPEMMHMHLKQKLEMMHAGIVPSNYMSSMLTAQRYRDATLADSMIGQNRGNGAVLIAGREHVRKDYGAPFYIEHREPDARIVSMAFVDDLAGLDALQSQNPDQPVYDFVWLRTKPDRDQQPDQMKVVQHDRGN